MLSISLVLSLLAGSVLVPDDRIPARVTGTGGEPDPVLEIPLEYEDGRILVPVAIDGIGDSPLFILDTAAGRSVISPRLRDRLPLGDGTVRQDTVHGSTGPAVMEFVALPPLSVGDRSHPGLWAVVADLSDFREAGERSIQGILGMDLLISYDLEIDVPEGLLRLHPRDGSAAAGLSGTAARIPFHSPVQDGFVHFTAALGGEPVEALLDTGTRLGTMNWKAAALVGVDPNTADLEAGRGAGGIGGTRVTGSRYLFDGLCLGQDCLPPSRFEIADLPVFTVLGIADGPAMLFGTALLERCPVLISYSDSTFYLCPEGR